MAEEKASPQLAAKAKEMVLNKHPDAFCQKTTIPNTVGTYQRYEYTIQRLIKSKSNVDGDEREDLGPTAFSEDDAWIYACDRIARYDNYYAM